MSRTDFTMPANLAMTHSQVYLSAVNLKTEYD